MVFLFYSVLSGLDPALLGLALTYAVTLSGLLQYTVRQSAEVENLVSDIVVSSLFFFLLRIRLHVVSLIMMMMMMIIYNVL